MKKNMSFIFKQIRCVNDLDSNRPETEQTTAHAQIDELQSNKCTFTQTVFYL